MLNLSVAVSVKDAGLPFICVIKGSKRKQHRFDNEYIEHLFVYDTKFKSLGSVELNNVFLKSLRISCLKADSAKSLKKSCLPGLRKTLNSRELRSVTTILPATAVNFCIIPMKTHQRSKEKAKCRKLPICF